MLPQNESWARGQVKMPGAGEGVENPGSLQGWPSSLVSSLLRC